MIDEEVAVDLFLCSINLSNDNYSMYLDASCNLRVVTPFESDGTRVQTCVDSS